MGIDRKCFVGEFEINASVKVLFPYLDTPSGLLKWFADDVSVNQDKKYIFTWNNEEHTACMVNYKINHYVKFQFIEKDDSENLGFIELRLEQSELTESVFLIIIDSSGSPNDEELYDIWYNQVQALKETVGG